MKFISKVGIEPTFLPMIKAHPYLLTNPDICNSMYIAIAGQAEDTICGADDHKWLKNLHRDHRCLEVPSSEEYPTLQSLMTQYTKLVRVMSKYGFHPSSTIDIEAEGGCHVNVDLSEHKSAPYRANLYHNIRAFLNNYPSLAWSFLAQNDDQSSVIPTVFANISEPGKGDALNFRKREIDLQNRSNDYCQYIELRFFMMPRTNEEMELHLKVADAYVRHIIEISKSGTKLKFKNNRSDFAKYTYDKARTELMQVLKILSIDQQEVRKTGKFQILKKRISYGKAYLV